MPLSFAQQRLWFLDRLEPGTPVYNMPGAVDISGPLMIPALATALSIVVARHEPLRTVYVIEQGRKEYQVQRYKGLGEMTAPQLWETTMDPERRTLLQVKLEDIAACEEIFTTLMGEDVESRRKFIEENALDVKNLDI